MFHIQNGLCQINMRFNRHQLNFIQYPLNTHICLIAPPGSGKTQVTSARIAYLIKQGVAPQKILASTFNVKAADELTERLYDYQLPALPPIRNYHKVGSRMNRAFKKKGLIKHHQFIQQEWQVREKAKQILLQTASTDINPNDPATLEDFVSFISVVKSQLLSAEDTFTEKKYCARYECFIDGFEEYEKLREQQGFQTFDDLLYDPVRVLMSTPSAVAFVENHVDHILIDEFQDMNPITFALFSFIAGSRAYITGIGDDDQTINVYRGSDPFFIVSGFSEGLQNVAHLQLAETYRFGHITAIAANQLIQHNKIRHNKICVSGANTPHTQISLGYYDEQLSYRCPHQHSLLHTINKHSATGRDKRDVGVLLRTYHISPWIEFALIRERIPYRVEDGRSALSLPFVQGLKAFAALHIETEAEPPQVSLVIFLLNHPVLPVKRTLLSQLASLVAPSKTIADEDIDSIEPTLSPYVKTIVRTRINSLNTALSQPWSQAISTYFESEIHGSYTQQIATRKQGNDIRNQSILVAGLLLLKSASSGDDLLRRMSPSRDGEDAITIATLNSSKGCAWHTVIIPACVETILPYQHPDSPTDIEDERRLMYVGITRARQHLHLITTEKQGFHTALQAGHDSPVSTVSPTMKEPSRFLYEMRLPDSEAVGSAITLDKEITLTTTGDVSVIERYITTLEDIYNGE
jgi:DNA helicase-2/ATP-dependent DNA helicase PcrA